MKRLFSPKKSENLLLDLSGSSGPDLDKPVLSVEDFSIVYRSAHGDVKAVDHVSLELARSEVLGLAGESGSGKSTLAYGACRLLRSPALITGGKVTYAGRRAPREGIDITSLNAHELRQLRWKEISIVFQSAMNSLNPVITVGAQLDDAIKAHMPLDKHDRHERAGTLMDLAGIPRQRLRSYPHELSGGMRQRVMIAMALAADPDIVIMDEPTTALDVVVQREILTQIIEIKEQLGFAIIFITHDLSLLLELSDRIAIMYGGKLLEIAPTKNLQHKAAHPYTEGLLASFPSLTGPKKALAGIPGSPPDLRSLPPGCPFFPRCRHAGAACRSVDMLLKNVSKTLEEVHLSACPFHPGPGADKRWRAPDMIEDVIRIGGGEKTQSDPGYIDSLETLEKGSI
ncbi:MAG: ABC transporter ATP-binding protein [Firmicutes bacterium]|nr:ABC transporter ATP-binding protein [Bacillota bacterium]